MPHTLVPHRSVFLVSMLYLSSTPFLASTPILFPCLIISFCVFHLSAIVLPVPVPVCCMPHMEGACTTCGTHVTGWPPWSNAAVFNARPARWIQHAESSYPAHGILYGSRNLAAWEWWAPWQLTLLLLPRCKIFLTYGKSHSLDDMVLHAGSGWCVGSVYGWTQIRSVDWLYPTHRAHVPERLNTTGLMHLSSWQFCLDGEVLLSPCHRQKTEASQAHTRSPRHSTEYNYSPSPRLVAKPWYSSFPQSLFYYP